LDQSLLAFLRLQAKMQLMQNAVATFNQPTS